MIKHKEHIQSVSFANNIFFNNNCIKYLIEFLQESHELKKLSLEKLSISDNHIISLFEALPHTKLEELNLSSNTLTHNSFERLSKVIKESGNCLTLKKLNLSNTKLNDRAGVELF